LKNLSWRLITILAVILVAAVYVIPTFRPGIWPHKKINLGLDLQGGMHLVLEVDADKAVENTIERMGQEMRELLRKERIRTVGLDQSQPTRLVVKVADTEAERLDELLDEEFRDLRIVDRSDNEGVREVVLDLPDKETEHIRKLPWIRPWKPSATASTSSASVNRTFAFRGNSGF
jgi:preprotein translocase subunit SecD